MSNSIPREQLTSPSWTPGRRDFAALIALLGEDDRKLHALVEKALLRAGPAGQKALQEAFASSVAPLRGRIVRAASRFAEGAGNEALFEWFVGLCGDEDARTRRAAYVALSRGSGEAIEALLIEAWGREEELPAKRALVEALGKVGGRRARDFLSSLRASEWADPELRRLQDEALLRLRRVAGVGGSTVEEGRTHRIDASRSLPGQGPVHLHCRIGLEEILAAECPPEWRARPSGAGVVAIDFRGPLSRLGSLRTALHAGFVVEVERGGDPVEAVARASTSHDAAMILERLTDGPVRYRIDYGGGRQRAAVLRLAEAVTARRPAWVNDPRDRDWEIVVVERIEGTTAWPTHVELTPRLVDERFPWRVADVPAASHPTLAAALARVAGADARDVVWDPFCGSGSELVERARLGPYRALCGSDIEQAALEAARANLAAAGLRDVIIAPGEALDAPPLDGVTLIVTNPPMGRRVHRRADLSDFLDRFVTHAAKVLRPGGRLVWLSPHPEQNLVAAERAGLRPELRRSVDMGGFRAELQRLRKGP